MIDSLDAVMLAVEAKLNTSPQMHVKLRWFTKSERSDSRKNDPDFWLGVCYSAYQKQVVTKDEMKDILLALRAAGAKSSYFKEIVKEILA